MIYYFPSLHHYRVNTDLILVFHTLLVITSIQIRNTWGLIKGRLVKGKENKLCVSVSVDE